MKKYIVIVLMLMGHLALFGQNPCEIYFEEKTADNVSVEIDVKADGFTNVFGYQMYVKWDSTVLNYNSITYSHPELTGMLFSTDLGANILSSGWSAVLQTKTFPAGTTLFTVKYDYEGDPCDETTLELTDPDQFRQSLIIYSDGDDEAEFPLNFVTSTVQIPGTDCGSGGQNEGFGLLINDEIAAEGSTVCVPIKVDSFVNIQALQFSVCWDKTILSWQGEENNWAMAQGANALSNVLGDSVYYYLMDSPTPLNLADGSVLVELCFEVLGNNGDVSSVEFCDALPFEVTDANSNSLDYYTVDGSVTVGDIDNAVTFTLSNETADQNSEICVDVTGKNFNAIESFQYMVEWDPNVMTWNGLGDVNNINIIYNPSGGGHISKNGNNRINVSWDSAFGETEPDGGVLFQLCFDVIGECNESSSIAFLGGPGLPIEVTSNGIVLPHIEVPGSVTIKCEIVVTEINISHVKCNGGSTGRIDVVVAGNPNDYNFTWNDNPSVNSPSRNGLTAGTYIVTISDKNDPTITLERTIIVTEPSLMEVTSSTGDETCTAKGSVDLTVTGGTAPYTYEWSNGGNTKNISNLDAGDYSVTVTDANDCPSIIKSFTITNNIPGLTTEIASMTDITCFDAEDGTATISVSGGCLPYEIVWSDGVANTLTRVGLKPGNISVTVKDAKDQQEQIDFTFNNPDKLEIVNSNVVEGLPSSIDIEVIGGTGQLTYSWTGPNYSANTEDVFNITESGDYTVVVTDENGCTAEQTWEDITVVIDPISMEVFVDNKQYSNYGIKCNGECNGSVDATINANVPWEVFLDGDKITLPYDELCAGEHTIKIVDREGFTIEETFTVTEPDQLTVVEDEVVCSNDGKDDGSISVSVSGGAGDYTYDWGISGEDDYIIENLPKGTYAVSVSDENDCVVISEDFDVKNCDRSDCYQGTLILTPNGDEFNEYFLVRCFDDFESNDLNVYDRLGNKVYTQSGYDGTWNGLDSNGNELIEDSYMWVFIGVKENGAKEVYKGTVTILR